jgi:transposase
VRAVFPKGNIYIHLRDTLGSIDQDGLFEDLYPDRGQPAYAPWRLALVTVFQFMENLTDRQAADAVILVKATDTLLCNMRLIF